jgi:hypothetical protein
MAVADDIFHFAEIQLFDPTPWAPAEQMHFAPIQHFDIAPLVTVEVLDHADDAAPADAPAMDDTDTETGDTATTDGSYTVPVVMEPDDLCYLTDDEIAMTITDDTVTTVDGTEVAQNYLPTQEVQPAFHITATASVDLIAA